MVRGIPRLDAVELQRRTLQSMTRGTLGGTVRSARPYKTKRPYSFDAVPSQLSAFAWFRADTLGLSTGDPVPTWPDSSGNGRDGIYGDAIYSPVGGTPAVRIGNDVDAFYASFNVWADGEDNWTGVATNTLRMFLVATYATATSPYSDHWYAYAYSWDADYLNVAKQENIHTLRVYAESQDESVISDHVGAAGVLTPSSSNLLLIETWRTPGDNGVSVNGVTVASGSENLGSDGLALIMLGMESREWFAEAVFLTDDTNAAAWRSYLQGKYGL